MWQIRMVAPPALIGIFVFLFGLIIGSFLNVCIVRIPSGKSIVMPASACPKCGAPIRPYDNIPVVSYAAAWRKMPRLQDDISSMYPAGRTADGAALSGRAISRFGLTVEALKWAMFSALMVVLVFTDLRERILPDVVNFTGFGIGLVAEPLHQADGWHRALDREASLRLPSPGAGAFVCRRASGRGRRQRPAVAGLRSVFPVARARRHGTGRRQNDADGRRISGREADAAHDLGGLAARKRAGHGLYSRAAQRNRTTNCRSARFSAWRRCWWFFSARRS